MIFLRTCQNSSSSGTASGPLVFVASHSDIDNVLSSSPAPFIPSQYLLDLLSTIMRLLLLVIPRDWDGSMTVFDLVHAHTLISLSDPEVYKLGRKADYRQSAEYKRHKANTPCTQADRVLITSLPRSP
jgi:hypothetical protein